MPHASLIPELLWAMGDREGKLARSSRATKLRVVPSTETETLLRNQDGRVRANSQKLFSELHMCAMTHSCNPSRGSSGKLPGSSKPAWAFKGNWSLILFGLFLYILGIRVIETSLKELGIAQKKKKGGKRGGSSSYCMQSYQPEFDLEPT